MLFFFVLHKLTSEPHAPRSFSLWLESKILRKFEMRLPNCVCLFHIKSWVHHVLPVRVFHWKHFGWRIFIYLFSLKWQKDVVWYERKKTLPLIQVISLVPYLLTVVYSKFYGACPKVLGCKNNMARSVRCKDRVDYNALNNLSSANFETASKGKRKYKPG